MKLLFFKISSVQLLSHAQLFLTLGLQHARLPCPSPTPKNTVLQVGHTFYLFFHVDVKFSYKLYSSLQN